MGVRKVIHPLLPQGSSLRRKFMETPSSHSKLEDCGSGHFSACIHFPCGIIYLKKNVAILHPQKQRCGVGYVKMGSGGMIVKHFIHPLAPYFIYVCGNLQYIPLVIEIVD